MGDFNLQCPDPGVASLGYFYNVHLAVRFVEFHLAFGKGEEREISTHTHVVTRVIARASLP